MSSISAKGAASPSTAKPTKIMPNDPERLHMSRDQSIAKDRKLREIDAKMELERQRLEDIANKEEQDLIAAGNEDNDKVAQQKEEEIAALKEELAKVKAQQEANKKEESPMQPTEE